MAGSQEKTEKPTGKKIQEARSRGNVAKSAELNSSSVLLIGGIATYMSSHSIYEHYKVIIQTLWGEGFRISSGYTPDPAFFGMLISHFLLMIAPTVLASIAAAVVINCIQLGGFLLSTKAIRPELSKLNPLNGFSRFVSPRALVDLAKSILKLLIVGYTVYGIFLSEQETLMKLSEKEPVEILEVFGQLAYRALIKVCGIMLFVSLFDYAYQRWQYNKDLMMTKQEVKEESKQSEGNPQVKAKIRSLQMAMARQRMMANVPKASVVITNPTHYAVALQYGQDMEAPKVVAKGANYVAQKIIKIARKSKVPVVQSPPLARALYNQVKLDESIPVTLYRAVARILAYIYQQKKASTGMGG